MKKILALVMTIVTLMTIVLPINVFAASLTTVYENESNNTMQTANFVQRNSKIIGKTVEDDYDWFEIYLKYESDIRLVAYTDAYLYILELYNERGVCIADYELETIEGAPGKYRQVINGTFETGTYYIKCYSYADYTEDYTLTFECTPKNKVHEHNYEKEVCVPTCSEGYTMYTCKCGDCYVTDYIPAVHAFNADRTVCTFCGYEVGKENGWIYEADGNWHCYEDGAVVTNKWFKDDNGWRYADENGLALRNTWQKDSAGWCYLGNDGVMLCNKWVADSVGMCYVNASGYMVYSKWIKDDDGWCYVNGAGYRSTSKWVKDSKGWCYVGADGYMTYNKWVKDSKGWCYVGNDGYMVYSQWAKDSTGWCYVGANGYMTYNKWVKDSKGWCYVGSNGYMVCSKWLKYDGSWYFLCSDGHMATGYKKIDDGFYYFYGSGKMLANTTHGSAYVDGSGKLSSANFLYFAGNDFRSEKREFNNTRARCGYIYLSADSSGSVCVMSYIFYDLNGYEYEISTLHDLGRGQKIVNASDYYSNLADRYTGNTKLYYMKLATSVTSMESGALKNGYYLHSSHPEFIY